MTFDEASKIVEEILRGIDQEETDTDDGWWETSGGAEFGAKKKAELLTFLATLFPESSAP